MYILISILVLIFAVFVYLRETWAGISFAEILFHLKTSFGGTAPEMIYVPLLKYGLPAILVIVLFVVGTIYLKKKNVRIYKMTIAIALACLLLADGISVYIFNKETRVISDFYHSVFGNDGEDFVQDIYVDASKVSMKFPEEKRNLIYIYLESMEVTFSSEENGGAFSDNYIPNLTKLSEENDNFSGSDGLLNGGISLPGTNWTTAALFAQTSGIPLDLPVHEESINKPEDFFPTITALGDALEKEGYTNTVQMGSSAGFGGVTAYYTGHGNYAIHDYNYAIKEKHIPSDYYQFWGYEDTKLIEFAKQELTELAKADTPFNYTMFTIDTHVPGGRCPLCGSEWGDNLYANVLSCSDRQVSAFIDWIKQQDFYDNTTIVITGDHPTMNAPFVADIDSDYQRKTYTCIINSAVEPQLNTRREYATLDLYPTILASLGVKLSKDRLGCGTNLYGKQQTIIEEYGAAYCWEQFAKNSKFVESLVRVKMDDEKMQTVQDGALLEVCDENGTIRFRLRNADGIDYLNITELKLIVHDNNSGEDYDFDMNIEVARSGWMGIVHSDVPAADINDFDYEIYISVDDYDHYLFLDSQRRPPDLWDLRWDVDF